MYFKMRDLEVYYEEKGNVTDIPVIMLNGFGLDSTSMIGAMEPIFLKNSGFRRIYFDLPGTGRTKGSSWIKNADDMLEIILKFIDEVIGDNDFFAVGYSYGGYLVRGIMAKRANLNGMLLVCPVIYPDNNKRELPDPVVLYQDQKFLESLHPDERHKISSVIQNEYVWNRLKNEIFPSFETSDGEFLKEYRYSGYEFSFNPDSQVSCLPVMIITGKQDSVVGWKDAIKLLDYYPRSTYIAVDMASHDLNIEQPLLFEQLTQKWLLDLHREF